MAFTTFLSPIKGRWPGNIKSKELSVLCRTDFLANLIHLKEIDKRENISLFKGRKFLQMLSVIFMIALHNNASLVKSSSL